MKKFRSLTALFLCTAVVAVMVSCDGGGSSSSSSSTDTGLTRTNTPAKIRVPIPKSMKKDKNKSRSIVNLSRSKSKAPDATQAYGYSNIANAFLDMEMNTINLELNMLLIDQVWDQLMAEIPGATGSHQFANGELKITFSQEMYDFMAKAFEDLDDSALEMFQMMIGQEVPLNPMKITVNADTETYKYEVEITEEDDGKSIFKWSKDKTKMDSYSSWTEDEDTDEDGIDDKRKSYVNSFNSHFPTDGSAYSMTSGYQQTNLTLDVSGNIDTSEDPEKFSTIVHVKQDMANTAKDGIQVYIVLKDKTSFDDGMGGTINIDMEVNSWGKADDDGGFLESYVVDVGQDVELQEREFFDANGTLTGYFQLVYKPAGMYDGEYESESYTWEPAVGLTVQACETSVYFDADIKTNTKETIEAALSGNSTERDYSKSLTEAASGKTVDMYAIIPNGVSTPTEGDVIGSVQKEESSGSWNVSFRGTTEQLTARPNVYLVHYAADGSKTFTQVANVSVRKPDDRDEYNTKEFDTGGYFQEMCATRDSSGYYHVVYESRTDWKLYYATNKNGSWTKEKITTASGDHFSQGIAIDSNGKVHIIYNIHSGGSFGTSYVTNATGSWVTTEIAAVGSSKYRADIAVDSTDKVHIAYIDSSDKLQYVNSDNWTSKTDIDFNATSVKIGIDNSKVHVAYTNGANLMYANSDNWTSISTISGIGNKYVSDIIFNSSNKVYIACIHDDDVYIANNSNGSWAKEKVDEYYRHKPTIVFDSGGNLHMTCAFAGPGMPFWLRYATNESGTWKTREIHQDKVKGAGNTPFIFIDTSDNNKIEIIHQAWVGGTIDMFHM